MKNEMKVGILVILGAIVFATAVLILSGIRILEKGYEINIVFNDIQGLLKQAKVQVAGVNVGYVKNITLDDGRARVTVWLDKDVKIYKDTGAFIFSSGIIGVKFIQLSPGGRAAGLLKNGDTIVGVDPISIDKMFDKTQMAVNSLLDSIRGITTDSSIKTIIANLDKFSADLKNSSKDFKQITTNLKDVSSNIKKISSDGRIEQIMKKTDSAISSLEKISKKVESGTGVVGGLVSDKKLEKDLKDTINSLRVFSKLMEEAPSRWIVDEKKAKAIRKEIRKQEQKNK